MKRTYILGALVMALLVPLGILTGLSATGVFGSDGGKLVFSSASQEMVYSGSALKNEEWTLESGELQPGHTPRFVWMGSQTEVGNSENSFSVSIFDENNADVTEDYEIECIPGKLTVLPSELYLQADSLNKQYDGKPLKKDGYQVLGGELAPGHVLEVFVVGERVYVGQTENVLSARVYDANGKDVTANYDITTSEGDLTVLPNAVTIESPTLEKVYDGAVLSDLNLTVTAGNVPEGHQIVVTSGASLTDVGMVQNAFAFEIHDAEGRDVTQNFAVTALYGTLTVAPREITVQTETVTDYVYDGNALFSEIPTLTDGSVFELVEGEMFVVTDYPEIVDVGTVVNDVDFRIFTAAGDDVTQNYAVTVKQGNLTVLPREITVESYGNEKVYDATPLVGAELGAEMTEGELAEGQTLSVDLPISLTNVGKADNAFTATVTDAEGNDVTKNYAITSVLGGMTVTKREITVRTEDDSKTYDGTPLTNENWEFSWNSSMAEGHTLTVDVVGSRVDFGESENVVLGYAITDQTESESDAFGTRYAENYEVKINPGTLTVTKRSITLESDSKDKVFDGTPLTGAAAEGEEPSARQTSGTIADGQELRFELNAQITDVGDTKNVITYHIVALEEDGSERDVTQNYAVKTVEGSLTITHRIIQIYTSGDTKVYDGTPLTAGWEYVEGSLREIEGHRLNITMAGAQTDYGSSANKEKSYFVEGEDPTKLSNYKVDFTYGTLKVNPRPITVESYGDVKTYDGAALKGSDVGFRQEPVFGEIVSGQRMEITLDAQITDFGTVRNALKCVILEEGTDRNVTENYLIDKIEGDLVVEPRPVRIKTAGLKETYTGTAWSKHEWEYFGETDHFLEEHDFIPEMTAEITDVGSVDNDVDSYRVQTADGVDVTKNYDVEVVSSELTVEPIRLTLRSKDKNKPYDGTPLVGADVGWETDFSTLPVADGQQLEAELSAKITDAGDTPNGIVWKVVWVGTGEEIEKMTENYDVTVTEGTLTVSPRVVKLQTASKFDWVYRGTPFTQEDVAETERVSVVSKDNFLDGHEFTYTSNVSVIVGSGTYVISDFDVKDAVTGDNRTLDGNLIKDNYDIEVEFGTWTVKKRPVTFKSEDPDPHVYDGKVFSGSKEDVSVIGSQTENDGLLEGHEYLFEMREPGTEKPNGITNVWESGKEKNHFEVTMIRDEKTGRNVTECYAIDYRYGALTITPRPVTLKSNDFIREYNGKTQRDDSGNVTVEAFDLTKKRGLLSSHELVIEMTGEITNVNQSAVEKNTYSVVGIKNVTTRAEIDENILNNYDFEPSYGKMELTPFEFTLKSAADSKTYDGTPLTAGWKVGFAPENVQSLFLEHGDILEASLEVSITDYREGGVPNTITWSVKKLGSIVSDSDLKDNYLLEDEQGNTGRLSIEKKQIIITSNQLNQTYNGKPLIGSTDDISCHDEDFTPICEMMGVSITNVLDKGVNEFEVTEIRDKNGDSVSLENFYIDRRFGEMTVTPLELKVFYEGESKEYDGTPLRVTLSKIKVEYDENGVGKTLEVGEDGVITGRFPVDGQTVRFTSNTAVTDVLKSRKANISEEIIYTATSTSADQNNYIIKDEDIGRVERTKRGIILSTADGKRQYNGESFSGGYEVGGSGLAPGDTFVEKSRTEITNVKRNDENPLGEVLSVYNVVEYEIWRDGENVTSNYEVDEKWGTLMLTPVPVKFHSESLSKTYDGTPLYGSDRTKVGAFWQNQDPLLDYLAGYELMNSLGHSPSYGGPKASATDVFVGEKGEEPKNEFTVQIWAGGDEVTENYDISYDPGVLTVFPLEISVETSVETSPAILKKYYDGTPLTAKYSHFSVSYKNDKNEWQSLYPNESGEFSADEGFPVQNQGLRLDLGADSSITTPGTKEVIPSVSVIDGKESNYNIRIKDDTLTLKVEKAVIEVSTNSVEFVYDGKEHSGSFGDVTIWYNGGKLNDPNADGRITKDEGFRFSVAEHELVYQMTGSVKDVKDDERDNSVSVDVVTGDETSVKDYYIIRNKMNIDNKPEVGTLKVTPRPLHIKTGSTEVYLTDGGVSYPVYELVNQDNKSGLLEGHDLNIVFQTFDKAGKWENVPTINSITMEEDNKTKAVTENYKVYGNWGTVTVLADDASIGYSDSNHHVADITSTIGGTVYLREKSYGTYLVGDKSSNPSSWAAARSYGGFLDDGYGMNYLAGTAFGSNDVEPASITVEIVLENYKDYMLPYYLAMGGNDYYTVQSGDVVNLGNSGSSLSYTVPYYDVSQLSSFEGISVPEEYRQAERDYRDYVYQNYLSLPPSTKKFLDGIIASKGFAGLPDTKAKIDAVADYVKNSARWSIDYDRDLDKEKDIVKAFLSGEYSQGICQHFATAGTALFRALGIPARYTVGYLASDLPKDKPTTLMSKSAHAWVEVYLDGIGWIPVEVTGSSVDLNLRIQPSTIGKVFDGTPLDASTADVHIDILGEDGETTESLTKDGYTWEATFSGSQTVVGKSRITIVSFTLFYQGTELEEGVDYIVDMDSYRNEEENENGWIVVYEYEVTIRTASVSKEYDGTPIKNLPEIVEVSGLRDGHKIDATFADVSFIDAGRRDNACTIRIIDEVTGEDVTDQYKVNKQYGKVEITALQITIITDDAFVAYDPSNPTVETGWSCDGLPAGFTVDDANLTYVTVSEMGQYENAITGFVVRDANGNDVNENGKNNVVINYEYGSIFVF